MAYTCYNCGSTRLTRVSPNIFECRGCGQKIFLREDAAEQSSFIKQINEERQKRQQKDQSSFEPYQRSETETGTKPSVVWGTGNSLKIPEKLPFGLTPAMLIIGLLFFLFLPFSILAIPIIWNVYKKRRKSNT